MAQKYVTVNNTTNFSSTRPYVSARLPNPDPLTLTESEWQTAGSLSTAERDAAILLCVCVCVLHYAQSHKLRCVSAALYR